MCSDNSFEQPTEHQPPQVCTERKTPRNKNGTESSAQLKVERKAKERRKWLIWGFDVKKSNNKWKQIFTSFFVVQRANIECRIGKEQRMCQQNDDDDCLQVVLEAESVNEIIFIILQQTRLGEVKCRDNDGKKREMLSPAKVMAL